MKRFCMYGMVNQAIKEMVQEVLGPDSWQEVCQNINRNSDDFELFNQFDDQITLDLVTQICKTSGMRPEKLLEAFGVYWIKFAQNSDYSAILSTFATSAFDLIHSLNNLHERLELTFSNLKAPAFEVIEHNDKMMKVNYYSDRAHMPLEFFVKGLFIGIFKMFNQECKVEMIATLGSAKATFVIEQI